MKTARPLKGWRPTAAQELLLRAAVSVEDAASISWREWEKSNNFIHLDGESARLLPLVYHNLRLNGVEELTLESLKNEYVSTWFNNELLFDDLTGILLCFEAAGIETIVLKGVALALHYYGDAGLRPMNDVDVLVRPSKAKPAMAQLREAGWRSIYETPEVLIPYQHALEFSNSQGHRLDLHWRVLWDGSQEISDDDFWQGAIAGEINNLPVSILNPTDQLLHVCVHGSAWSALPPVRWVADAAVIIRTAGADIDWDRLIEQTLKRRLMLPMRDTLGYLQRFLANSVPSHVVEVISNIPVSRLERALYRLRIGPNAQLRRLNTLYYWVRAWQLRPYGPTRLKTLEFARYLKSFLVMKYLAKRHPAKTSNAQVA